MMRNAVAGGGGGVKAKKGSADANHINECSFTTIYIIQSSV